MEVSDLDIAQSFDLLQQRNIPLYIHTQYIFNLASPATEDHYANNLMAKNLQYGKALGCRGVVVHVGKHVKINIKDALEMMRHNILAVLQYATKECPFLLETPAGQGTELLTDMTEFIEFVLSFDDDRIAICVDTCHVFALGYSPIEYLENVLKHKGVLKLVHFNDSLDVLGSRKDRHARVGQGKIGLKIMEKVARICSANSIHMVTE